MSRKRCKIFHSSKIVNKEEDRYDFEQNKRNNLIFYGLNNDVKETPELLMSKIQTIIKVSVGIRRDIPIPKVMRMYNGE